MKSTSNIMNYYRSESAVHLGVRYRKEWLSIGNQGTKGYVVVHVDGRGAEEEADTWGQHICAAVNACAGIPTEALRGGVVADLLEFAELWLGTQPGAAYKQFLHDEVLREKAIAAIAKARG